MSTPIYLAVMLATTAPDLAKCQRWRDKAVDCTAQSEKIRTRADACFDQLKIVTRQRDDLQKAGTTRPPEPKDGMPVWFWPVVAGVVGVGLGATAVAVF